jgi:hypothetical protein
LSLFSHGFGRGLKGKRTTKGSCIHPPTNPQENSLEISTRKSPRKGSENHQKGKSEKTQTSLEEPRRIIYTYCQMVRSEQPTGVLIPVVYLFGREDSKAKNSKVTDEYTEHRQHDEFILVRASRE